MKYRLTVITVLLIVVAAMPTAKGDAVAPFMPIVTSYSQAVYGGGMQNWSATQDGSGLIYFGNNRGLLAFDGYHWQLTPLPSRGVVRSVLADGDRVYVGTYTDFGYFERDASGRRQYYSLWPDGYESHNDEIWNIVKAPDGHIYFQSFCSWFDYDGRTVTAHYDPARLPLNFFVVGQEVYVQLVNDDFYRLTGSRYVRRLSRSDYNNDNIVAVLPADGNNLLLVTAQSGIYRYDGRNLSAWHTAADAELKSRRVNKAVMQGDHTVVVGTILGGIYAFDLTGRTVWYYHMRNGLNNNTTLNLLTDRDENVWATLDNGISLIHSGLPIDIMRTDLQQPIGMVYGLDIGATSMHIATNQAVWHYDLPTGAIRRIANTEGQNWYVSHFGNQLFAGNNLGTLSIAGSTAAAIPGATVGGTCIRHYREYGQDVLLEAGYNDFRVYRPIDGRWTMTNTLAGFQSPILEFEIDNSGALWAAHMSMGLYRLEPSHDLSRVVNTHYYGSLNPDEPATQIHVTKIRGRVVFSSGGTLYTYDDISEQIVRYDELDRLLPDGLISSTPIDKQSFWVSDSKGYSLVSYRNDQPSLQTVIPFALFGLECNVNGVSQYVSDSTTYFFLNNGVGRYRHRNADRWQPAAYPLTLVGVESIRSGRQQESLPTSDSTKIRVHSGTVRFTLSYPNYNYRHYHFEFVLKGNGEEIVFVSDRPVVTFNSLSYGNYTLTCSVVDAADNRRPAAVVHYSFSYPAPWYLSVWAWLLYAVALVAIVYICTRRYIDRMARINQRKAESELMRQSLKMMEQEQIIAEQQKQLIEHELAIKGKELASMAFQAAARKRSEESLKEELLEKKRRGSVSQKDIEKLLEQMSGTNDDEEIWTVFQQNFDLIHKHFFRNLRQKYPDLTPTDLKFCALLRLNLSTKDIARFTNLTIRGVEGARYRLRKKLAIPNEQSLTDFLIDFE